MPLPPRWSQSSSLRALRVQAPGPGGPSWARAELPARGRPSLTGAVTSPRAAAESGSVSVAGCTCTVRADTTSLDNKPH